MDIELALLRGIEKEKAIPFDELVSIIEQAILTAYGKHISEEGTVPEGVRVELDRKTGHVAVLQPVRDDEGAVIGEEETTPADFGRIAAYAAKQVIGQRLRDIADDAVLGEFRGKEGDIVAGVIQQSPDPRHVTVDFGTVEGILPLAEQVPGEEYNHGDRLRCYVVSVRRGLKGPQIALSRTHPNLVKKLFALEVPEIADGSVEIAALAREAGHRTKIAVRSKVPASTRRGRASVRWGSGSAR